MLLTLHLVCISGSDCLFQGTNDMKGINGVSQDIEGNSVVQMSVATVYRQFYIKV